MSALKTQRNPPRLSAYTYTRDHQGFGPQLSPYFIWLFVMCPKKSLTIYL